MNSRTLVTLGLAFAAAAAITTPALAQSRSPVDATGRPPIHYYPIENPRPFENPRPSFQVRSPVDSYRPGGGWGGYARCASTRVHDSYRLTLCDDGGYSVRGAGLSCQGSFNWQSTYGGVRINLRRSACGSGTDWSGDTIRCSGFVWNRRDLINKISSGTCTYFPTREAIAEGYRPERVYFR